LRVVSEAFLPLKKNVSFIVPGCSTTSTTKPSPQAAFVALATLDHFVTGACPKDDDELSNKSPVLNKPTPPVPSIERILQDLSLPARQDSPGAGMLVSQQRDETIELTSKFPHGKTP